MQYAIISRVCLLGEGYFEKISKSILRLLDTARAKMRIRIAVHNNQVYVKIIDNFCVIVHSREEGEIEPNGKLF